MTGVNRRITGSHRYPARQRGRGGFGDPVALVEVSSMPLIVETILGANAAIANPVATPVNLMLLGIRWLPVREYRKFGLLDLL